jgi:hypothetical protein
VYIEIRLDWKHTVNSYNDGRSKAQVLLKSNGAIEEKYLTSHVTHVICDEAIDSSEYTEANELFELTIVKVSQRDLRGQTNDIFMESVLIVIETRAIG